MKLQIVTGKIQRAQRVCFYGVESVGKTTLAAKAPAPLFLDVENGTSHLDIPRVATPTWAALNEAVRELATEKHDFKTSRCSMRNTRKVSRTYYRSSSKHSKSNKKLPQLDMLF